MAADDGKGSGGGAGYRQLVEAWTAGLAPLARELRRTEPGSEAREQLAADAATRLQGMLQGAHGWSLAAASPGLSRLAEASLPLLAAWPRLLTRLHALDAAVAELEQARYTAATELNHILAAAAGHWQRNVVGAPCKDIDAWWVAEQWAIATEAAWEERLADVEHGQALRELQAAREQLQDAARVALDAIAEPLGLPGPSTVTELEVAVDRLDRAHDRDINALQAEVQALRGELQELRGRGDAGD